MNLWSYILFQFTFGIPKHFAQLHMSYWAGPKWLSWIEKKNHFSSLAPFIALPNTSKYKYKNMYSIFLSIQILL